MVNGLVSETRISGRATAPEEVVARTPAATSTIRQIERIRSGTLAPLHPHPKRGTRDGSTSSASVGERAAAGRGCVALLVRAIARPDERPGEHRAEAEGLALLAEPAELVRMHPASDRRVLRRGLKVLADRDDVDAVLAQVAHRVDDFDVRLAEADDDPALRQHRIVGELLRAAQQPERGVVARLRAAHPAV